LSDTRDGKAVNDSGQTRVNHLDIKDKLFYPRLTLIAYLIGQSCRVDVVV
jgi:hypothetical protein